jgi:predicted glycoside hydrolase/deacetylase ChbG (UPF0249 family)
MNSGNPSARDTDGKLLIIHADDLGMCHSVNAAIFSAFEKGAISSASLMVPCPWFWEAAGYLVQHPNFDVGIHLTVTSEWRNYRWRPLCSAEPRKGMVDDLGYFWSTRGEFSSSANLDALVDELEAQVILAKDAGLKPSHLDNHMFALFDNAMVFQAYVATAEKFDLPFLQHSPFIRSRAPNPKSAHRVKLDRVYMAGLDLLTESWEEYYLDVVSSLRPGISQLIVHPGFDGPELSAMTGISDPWGARWRQRDYDVLVSDRFQRLLKHREVKVINWKRLGELALLI